MRFEGTFTFAENMSVRLLSIVFKVWVLDELDAVKIGRGVVCVGRHFQMRCCLLLCRY